MRNPRMHRWSLTRQRVQHARMSTSPAIDLQALEALDESGLRAQVQRLLGEVAQRDALLAAQAAQAERASTTLQFKDATIEKLKFELARYKRWAYGARTEGMTAEQRQLFEETSAEDLADLEARLARIQAEQDALKGEPPKAPRTPKREKLPEHLPRVEVHHEPASTVCANEACGQAMERIGEDISERLDIVPAEFRVERHIRGKWVCRCCQARGQDTLVQEPAEPHLIDGGIPTTGLLAHVLVQRFVDHLPYHRQEAIHARAGVHTPRSTLASWAGQAASELLPLYDAHRAFVLQAQVLHADETPVKMLDPGRGKTAKAYVWAYARGEFDPTPGVIYEFRGGRSGHHAAEFLKDWRGTLVTDAYSGYAQLFAAGGGQNARRLPGACPAQVRGARPGQPDGAGGAGAHRSALPRRGRGQGAECRGALANAAGAQPGAVGGAACLAHRAAEDHPSGQRAGGGHRLCTQALEHARGLPGRRRGAHRRQPRRAPDQALGDGAQGMAVRRQRTGRPARGHGHEPGAVGQALRA